MIKKEHPLDITSKIFRYYEAACAYVSEQNFQQAKASLMDALALYFIHEAAVETFQECCVLHKNCLNLLGEIYTMQGDLDRRDLCLQLFYDMEF